MTLSTTEGANGVGALVRVLAKPPLRRALIHVHTSAAGVHLEARKTGAVVVAGQIDTLLMGATFELPTGAFVHVGAAFACNDTELVFAKTKHFKVYHQSGNQTY